ncbi:DUF1540 domain-containing protein [Peribacillus sp. FSL H8-0477]|uniref:DUF1540 domain-containing protein n=1 Tax=Peribacillus sp. FSL H8-0477 TaxID=2921388 RepID=UPI0030FB836E
MPHGVKCSVDSCHFWRNGNRCSADHINVVSYTEERARTSEEVACKTFRPSEDL